MTAKLLESQNSNGHIKLHPSDSLFNSNERGLTGLVSLPFGLTLDVNLVLGAGLDSTAESTVAPIESKKRIGKNEKISMNFMMRNFLQYGQRGRRIGTRNERQCLIL